jgi:hypothetical protein
MTRYEQVMKLMIENEHSLVRDGVESLLLVVDLPDHRNELGSTHVDSARAVLDWFCDKYPDHPICVSSASNQNTDEAFREFGFHNLSREYNRLYLQDLNNEPMRSPSISVFLVGLVSEKNTKTRFPSDVWGRMHSTPQRHYTPSGEIFVRESSTPKFVPNFTIIDATAVKIYDALLESTPFRLDKIFSTADLNEADKISTEALAACK